jgi:hypothetical protein
MTDSPSRELTTAQAEKPPKVDRRSQISPQMKAALDSMVEEGLQFDEAAVKQNLTVRAMRLALKRPNVIKYLRDARQVFLAHVGASNIRRLRDLRDQDENRAAAVAAARTIEGLVENTVGSPNSIAGPRAGYLIDLSEQRAPGLVIHVHHAAPKPAADATGVVIDVTSNRIDPDDDAA